MNIYETDKLLAEYLLFHYGSADEILPAHARDMAGALFYPVRCVTECVDAAALPAGDRWRMVPPRVFGCARSCSVRD